MECLYLIDKKEGYKGNIISTVRNGYVDYSSELYNGNKGNLTVEEYGKIKNIEPAVYTWDELYPIIQEWEETNLITKFKEITEDHFNEMFEVLPPMRFTRISKGFLFFLSEMTSGNISACFIQYTGKYYTAQKRVNDDLNKLLYNFFNDIGKPEEYQVN